MNMLNDANINDHLTLGNTLKQARLAQNLTEADVAQQLLLGKHIIMALENDDYSKIVAPVYAKGYLKAYAQLLGLSSDTILKKFEQLGAYEEEQAINVSEIQEPYAPTNVIKIFTKRRVIYAVSGIILLLLVIVLALHQNGSRSEPELTANDSVETIPVITKAGEKEAPPASANHTIATPAEKAPVTTAEEPASKNSGKVKKSEVEESVPLPEQTH